MRMAGGQAASGMRASRSRRRDRAESAKQAHLTAAGRAGYALGAPSPRRGRFALSCPVPLDRTCQAVSKARRRAKAEQLLGARHVELAPRLAVRLRRVPRDLAVVAGQLGDHLRELPNRDLLARAEVDGLLAVVALRGEPDPFRAVLDEQ